MQMSLKELKEVEPRHTHLKYTVFSIISSSSKVEQTCARENKRSSSSQSDFDVHIISTLEMHCYCFSLFAQSKSSPFVRKLVHLKAERFTVFEVGVKIDEPDYHGAVNFTRTANR